MNQIRIKKVIMIALGLSLAINLSEILYFFNSPITIFETTRPTSIQLIIYRLSTIFFFCFFGLYFNIYEIDAWIKKITNKYILLSLVAINSIFCFVTFFIFINIQEQYIQKLPVAEHKGLSFVWFVLLVICILISTILKIRININKNLLGQEQFIRYSQDSKTFTHDLEVLEKSYLTSFLLPKKKILEPVKAKEFALFFIDNGIVKGKTFDSKVYFIDKSIQELEHGLNPLFFFRTNRQCLVNRDAIKHLEPDLFGKTGLRLKIDHKDDIVVSKLKTKQFKDWIVEYST